MARTGRDDALQVFWRQGLPTTGILVLTLYYTHRAEPSDILTALDALPPAR
ncbi:hypothetical protein ABZ851_01115 [Streptomyces sp. NPDC047049]|uniref:hypothetical protein n=1 Tax=Streptomyces sp. NPDC047049 TaxID=3156688 RepID=UPI0033DB1D83